MNNQSNRYCKIYTLKVWKGFRFLLLSNLIFAFEISTGQPKEKVVNGNPIIADMVADPSISKFGDTYYCYITTDGYDKGLKVSGPPTVWQSRDLVNWSFNGAYFPSAVGQLFWAPSRAVERDGLYYIYPTINRNIFVGVAKHPAGPFKLATGEDNFGRAGSAKPIVSEKALLSTKGIDAEVFIDDDRKAYLYWAQRGAARLLPNMLRVDSSSATVIDTKRKGYSEGPIMFKRNGVYYYLYTLDGHENYKYAYGYSKVSPLGPFVFPEEDIISKTDKEKDIVGPGHGNVFYNENEKQFYFTYLEFGNGGPNRQVYIDKIEFTQEGLIKPIRLTHTGVFDKKAYKKDINLARGKKVTASSILSDFKVIPVNDSTLNRVETYFAENAVDGSNGTRWMADSLTLEPAYITIDLGKMTAVKSIRSSFVKPTAGHTYKIEYSNNGRSWELYSIKPELTFTSPNIDNKDVLTRYLRLTIMTGVAGIWELNVN